MNYLYDNGFLKANFLKDVSLSSGNISSIKNYNYEFAFRGEFKETNENGGACYMAARYGYDYTTIEGCLEAFISNKSEYNRDRIACYISVHNKTLKKNVGFLLQQAKKQIDLQDYGLYLRTLIKSIGWCFTESMTDECRAKLISYEKEYESYLDVFREFKDVQHSKSGKKR